MGGTVGAFGDWRDLARDSRGDLLARRPRGITPEAVHKAGLKSEYTLAIGRCCTRLGSQVEISERGYSFKIPQKRCLYNVVPFRVLIHGNGYDALVPRYDTVRRGTKSRY